MKICLLYYSIIHVVSQTFDQINQTWIEVFVRVIFYTNGGVGVVFGGFRIWSCVITGSVLCFCAGIHHEEYSFVRILTLSIFV